MARRMAPRAAYVLLGAGVHGALYSMLAVIAARGDHRIGWRSRRPGSVNRAGLALVGAGVAMLGWAAAGHHQASDGRVVRSPSPTPTHLARGGAYAVTRNPLYLGGMTTWFGWATYLGSRRGCLAAVVWSAFLALVGVPYEERTLEATFGDAYRAYKREVPRWL